MACCRAISYIIKERTCCLIQPFPMTWSHKLFITKFHTNKAKEYCTSIKNERGRPKMVNMSKVNDVNVEKSIHSDFGNMTKHEKLLETDLYEESKHIESESKMNTTNNISERKNAVSHRGLHAMYSNPIHTVHNFYSIVNNELNSNNVLVHYKKSNSKTSPWKCIYSTTWPEKEEFIGHGVSKVIASKQAALKCLNWLHLHQKIQHGKPIVYSNEEIENKLHKPIPVNFNLGFCKEVKKLLKTYENDIGDIILHSQLNDNTSNFISSKKDFIYKHPASFLERVIRNKTLQDRFLLNNVDKKNTLSICKYRDEILQKIENNQVVVVKGDTGCGKTTQVPQFIIDSFIQNGNATDCNMLISQPRRISAISLAERVAFERKETVGDVVGYYVRLEANVPQFPGAILFCTTGILRQVIQANPNLIGYSHVILDEAHERSLDIDILLVLLKRAMQNNSTLKLIVMSATINTDLFQKYYNCTSIEIPGTIYPVKMHYMEDFQHVLSTSKNKKNMDYNKDEPIIDCNDVANLIRWIFETKPPGTILCFLPGWMEISRVTELLENMQSKAHKMLLLPLHSKLSNIHQRNIFKPAPPDITKVILATDIAETGITVPDVVYVVDSAIKNDLSWDERKFSLSMHQRKVSQANIQQRKGRAGRTQPGESYHFIRKDEYDHLEPYAIPEILRSSLEKTVVEIKNYTDEKVAQFCASMLQPPSTIALRKAVNVLRQLNILDAHENLTPLGKLVAQVPVHPTLSKALVLSTFFQCFQPMLYITTIYSMDADLFSNVLCNKSLKKKVKEHYHKTSDHLAMAMIYSEWQKNIQESKFGGEIFCNEMGISPFKLRLVAKTSASFIKYLENCNLLEDSHHSEMLLNKHEIVEEMIYGIILSSTNKLIKHNEFSYHKGVFRKKRQLLSQDNETVESSTESVNHRRNFWPSPLLTYFHSVNIYNRPSKYVNDCSIISPLTTLLFNQGEMYYKCGNDGKSGNIVLCIGRKGKLLFACNSEEAKMIIAFRRVIWSIIDYFIRSKFSNDSHELERMKEYKSEVLDVLSRMLSTYNKNEK